MKVGIKAAKADLSRLIEAAMKGERVIITDRGKPLVRLVPEAPKPTNARLGFGSPKGIINLPPGWDSPEADEELLHMFEGLK